MTNRAENEFNFSFDGRIDSLEVSTLTGSLLSLNNMIKEVNYQVGTNKKVELTVKTYRPGSFDVYLQLIADAFAIGATAGLFAGNNVEAAKQVIDVTLSILNFKKFLKGESPKEVTRINDDRVEIKDNHGNVFIADKIVFEIATNNEAIDKTVGNIFKPIDKVDGVSGVSIRDHEGKTKFESKKGTKEFDDMISPSPIIQSLEVQKRDKEDPEAILAVYGLVFDNEKKWEFYYQGNKIPVRLLAQDFIDKVMDRTYHFANGDRIKCKMIIHQVWNKTAMVFENKGYSVVHVYGPPIPPDPQSNMSFDD